MNPISIALVALVVAAAVGWALRGLRSPAATNWRSKRLPVVLGIALAVGLLVGLAPRLTASHATPDSEARFRLTVAVLVGAGIVFLGGLWDDLRPSPTHGLLAQLRPLLRGSVTSGAVKLLAALVGGTAFVLIQPANWSAARSVLAVLVVAGTANLVNLLDVRPGRAIKFAVPALIVLGKLTPPRGYPLVAAAAAGAAAGIAYYDLREQAMLGDAGATLLGFVVGVGLAVRLHSVALVAAFLVIVALHVVAETVSFSRIIEAAPPLRWIDRLGQLPAPKPELPAAEGPATAHGVEAPEQDEPQ